MKGRDRPKPRTKAIGGAKGIGYLSLSNVDREQKIRPNK